MKDISHFKQDMVRLRAAIHEALPDVAIILAMTAKALAEKIIRDRGFGAVYSSDTVPAYLLEGKQKSGAGLAFIKEAEKKGEEINWAMLRQAEGLQSQFVDLGFENKMWAGMVAGKPFYDGDVIRSLLESTTREGADKMKWSYQRYGDFISHVLKDQQNILNEVVQEQLIKVIKQVFQ